MRTLVTVGPHTKTRNMSVSRPNTPSVKKVSFATHTTPAKSNRPLKSITAKCEKTFLMGLATLHSGITSHNSVKEIMTQYVQSLLKFSEKIQALKRLQAPDFVPHTIRFKTTLKTDKATVEREDFKELANQFEALRLEQQSKFKNIMIEARKIEIEVRKIELLNIASKFVQEITGDLFIIHEYAENSDDINQKDLMEVHDAVFSRSAVKPVLFGLGIPSMPTQNNIEEESAIMLIDSDEDEETTDGSLEENTEELHKKRRIDQVSASQSSTTSDTTPFNQDTQGYVSDSDAISTVVPIVKDAVVATFVRTIEEFFKLEKEKAINDKLLKKKIQQEANANAAATLNETEKVLKELENGKSLKDLIDEHMKSSKGQRGVTQQNASLKNKNTKGKNKKKMNVEKKETRSKGKGKENSAGNKKNGSENAKPSSQKKNMRKEKKKKTLSKQKS